MDADADEDADGNDDDDGAVATDDDEDDDDGGTSFEAAAAARRQMSNSSDQHDRSSKLESIFGASSSCDDEDDDDDVNKGHDAAEFGPNNHDTCCRCHVAANRAPTLADANKSDEFDDVGEAVRSRSMRRQQ